MSVEFEAAGSAAGSPRPRLAARIGGALALIAVVGGAFWLGRSLAEDDTPRVGAIYDWARDFEALDELLAVPGAIAVVGTVTSVADGLPESVVHVDEVLVGSEVAVADRLQVLQFGARGGALAHEPRDARHLDLGERVLLVLAYDDTHNRYRIAGGPHGHFTIEGSRIRHANYGSREYGLSADHPDGHPLAILADELTLDEFKQCVTEAAPKS